MYYQRRKGGYPNSSKSISKHLLSVQAFQTEWDKLFFKMELSGPWVELRKIRNCIGFSRFGTKKDVHAINGNIGQPTFKSLSKEPARLTIFQKNSTLFA